MDPLAVAMRTNESQGTVDCHVTHSHNLRGPFTGTHTAVTTSTSMWLFHSCRAPPSCFGEAPCLVLLPRAHHPPNSAQNPREEAADTGCSKPTGSFPSLCFSSVILPSVGEVRTFPPFLHLALRSERRWVDSCSPTWVLGTRVYMCSGVAGRCCQHLLHGWFTFQNTHLRICFH